MKNSTTARTLLCALLRDIAFAPAVFAFDPVVATPVEHETDPSGYNGPGLGTKFYRPSDKEKPFFDRLPADEVKTGSISGDYNLNGKNKKYVGWFGIVRKIDEDTDADRTTLLVEHKYFDGLTDAHILALSFNGSGDFQARLSGAGRQIPPLSLVKVYGVVVQDKQGGLPRVDAVFVRNWHWGEFTFLAAYGKQRGSEKWRKANQVPLDDIYDPYPHRCHHYYEERLGKRPDGPEIRKRLIEAAGPLPPKAQQAMDRLVDLLGVGHPWTKAESYRQANEYSEIVGLVRATDSRKAARNLLLEALKAPDERYSSSASQKVAMFDPDGKAVKKLVSLLDHKSQAVRIGAAQSLSSGYGANAAPAAAAMSRYVAVSDFELR